jgi:hypothetical protein
MGVMPRPQQMRWDIFRPSQQCVGWTDTSKSGVMIFRVKDLLNFCLFNQLAPYS